MTPARLLAPAALVAAAIALFAILLSGGGNDRAEQEASPTPTVTATPTTAARKREKAKPSGRTYVVKPGDTPTAIAQREGVDVKDLLAVNPDINPAGLTVGEELQLP